MTEIKGIAGEIQKALKAYAYDVAEDIDIAKNEVSKEFKTECNKG